MNKFSNLFFKIKSIYLNTFDAKLIYNIDRIPKGFLLDPNGVIIAKDTELRGKRLGEKLNEIFN